MINRQKFFDGYRKAYGPLTQTQVDGLDFLLSQFEADPGFQDARWIAYALATIKHECADTWQPIAERGRPAYFAKYEPGTELGRQLGNVFLGDGVRYKGRGYVQITGRRNYDAMTKALSLGNTDNLVTFPERALDPSIAYRILSHGMRHGTFTGKSLGHYIKGAVCSYVKARRVINGNDRAELIAGYASRIHSILTASSS